MKKNIIGVLIAIALIICVGIASFFLADSKSYKATIYFMPKEYSEETTDFWVSMVNGAKAAAKELDVDLVILAPKHEVEYKQQQNLIEEALLNNPTAIVLGPCSPTGTYPYAKKIEDSGIPLVIVDSKMEKDVGQCVVSTDNIHAGNLMGEFLNNKIGDNDYIGIVSHVKGTSTAVEREGGLRSALMENESKIVDVVFSNSDYNEAYNETIKMLNEHPEITMIAGLNEYSAVGAARAIKDINRTDIMMIGFDSSLEEIQLLEEGIFEAIVVQYPFNMGYLGVTNAYRLARGEKVQYDVDSGTSLITKEDLYKEENQKNLFPFQ